MESCFKRKILYNILYIMCALGPTAQPFIPIITSRGLSRILMPVRYDNRTTTRSHSNTPSPESIGKIVLHFDNYGNKNNNIWLRVVRFHRSQLTLIALSVSLCRVLYVCATPRPDSTPKMPL